MRKIICLVSVCLSVMASARTVNVVNQGIRYCESTYPYDGGLLVANFGTEGLDPLNSEGKGYILFLKAGKSETLIAPDGNLSAPKGMFVRDGRLFVCDVNKIVVYNLGDKGERPRTIQMPEGNLFVNDLAADGDWLYASVTNSDKIYRIDISDPANPGEPREWLTVSGPNGLLIQEGKMYVASYPADGVTKAANVIYRVDNLERPVAQKLTDVAGQYDGIALSPDGRSLYVTNWSPAQLSRLDLSDGSLTPLAIDLPSPLVGPADISVDKSGTLYIPDLPNSRVIIVNPEDIE